MLLWSKLDLDAMTSIYEFDLKSPKMFLHTKHMNFPGQGFQNITHNITHRQTDRQTDVAERSTSPHSRVAKVKVKVNVDLYSASS